MKSIFIVVLIMFSRSAFADDGYYAGYNSGYYGVTNPPSNVGTRYGSGYEDGAYDADREDVDARKRSEEFEAALAEEQKNDPYSR